MGLQRDIRLAGEPPPWAQVRDRLTAEGLPAAVRMVDGQPAFPDEVPEPGWHELRLSLPAGMVTLRHTPGSVAVVVWGNADAALVRERDRLVAVLAALSGGTISD